MLQKKDHRSIPGRGGLVQPPRVGPAIIVATLCINLLALALPLVLLQIFDRVLPNSATETLTALFLGLCVALLLDLGLKWARIAILAHVGQTFECDLTSRFVDHALDADAREFAAVPSGTQFERLGAIERLRDHYAGEGRLAAIDLPFTLVFIAMIWLLGGWLVLVPVACFAAMLGFRVLLRRVNQPLLAQRRTVDGRRYSFLIEFFSQIVSVKSQTMETQMLRRFERLQAQSAEVSRALIRASNLSQSFGAVFSQAAVAGLGVFGGLLVIGGQIGVAELAACMLLNGRTVQPMLKLLGLWAREESVASAQTRIAELAAVPRRSSEAVVGRLPDGRLTFSNVGVDRQDGLSLFKGVSFDVCQGQCVAITGGDGSGKSSLLKVILAERDVAEGAVRIDGLTPREAQRARGRDGLVYLGADPDVFAGTILENLSLFGGPADIDQAVEAARSIGLERDIFRLPNGYQTEIGRSGRGGDTRGFLQRIALARALALRPRILLFNEANTALDLAADHAARESLERFKSTGTLVLVSRRPAYLALGDLRIDLDDFSERASAMQAWEDDKAAGLPELVSTGAIA